MISIIRASTGSDLTTLDAVQDILGAPTSDEGLLSRYITRASRWADTFVGRPLAAAVYQETVPAFDTRTLMLSRTPIRSLLRVFDSTATSEANDYSTQVRIEDAEAGLLSMDVGFAWTPSLSQDMTLSPIPGQETRPWLIEYEAGYVIGGTTSTAGGTTSTGETLPDDIEQAAIEKVRHFYEQRGGVTGMKVGDLSINYASGGEDAASELLTPYRRIV
jgi:hypothetical protein